MKYISAPLSNATDKQYRLRKIKEYAATCFLNNEHVVCPTTLGNALCSVHQEIKKRKSEWWENWYSKFFSICKEIDVLMFEGWENSYGVQKEIELAKQHNLKINYIKIENE